MMHTVVYGKIQEGTRVAPKKADILAALFPKHCQDNTTRGVDMSSFDCPTCGKQCNGKLGLQVHHRRAHGSTLPHGYNLACEQCGRPFRAHYETARFCSRDCLYDSMKVDHVTATCTYCGSAFSGLPCHIEGQNRKYCSTVCAANSKRLSDEESARVRHTCEQCGKVFWDYPSNSRRLCSAECRHRAHEGHTPWNKGDRTGKYLDCKTCGKTYYASPSRIDRDSKYCSWECTNEGKRRVTGKEHPLYSLVERECEWCDAPFMAKPAKIDAGEARFCSRNCVGSYNTAMQRTIGTGIEIAVESILRRMGVKYLDQKPMGGFCVDFFLPAHNLVIECDGDYWHSLPEVVEKDARKDAWMAEHGYNIVHLTESEINADAHAAVERALSTGGVPCSQL